MKKFLPIFLLLISKVCGGQNLIPNGDFEQHIGCPTALAQIDSCQFWFDPILPASSPDYFNQCGILDAGIPDNYFGYQQTHSGSGYCGMVLCYQNFNTHEYIETPLLSSLESGICYHFSMYVNLINGCRLTTDDISVYFSDTAFYSSYDPLQVSPQINNSIGNSFDTLNWTLVEGEFTASGGESFLVIGNFKDYSQINFNFINSSGFMSGSYVHVDDVSLIRCDSLNSINVLNQNSSINISPSPTDGNFSITASTNIQQIEVINLLGEKIYSLRCNSVTQALHLSSLSKGVYFISIKTADGLVMKKVVVE